MRAALQQQSGPIRTMSLLISGLLLFLPFIYLPGFGSYTIIRYFAFGTVALILGILMLKTWLAERWVLGAIKKSVVLYGLFIYPLIFLLVSITGIDPALSFFSSFVRADGIFTQLFLLLFALSVATVVLLNDERIVYQFLKSSVIAAVILSFLIMLSPGGIGFLQSELFERSRGGATIGNSSLAALYVVWNIFFALILIWRADRRKHRIGWIAALVTMTVSPLFMSWRLLLGHDAWKGVTSLIGTARGGFLGILIGVIVAAALWLATDAKKIRAYAGRAILAIIVIGMCSMGGLLLKKSSKVHEVFGDIAGGSRFIFWDSAWAGFGERPWLGWGPNTYSEIYHRNFNPDILLPGNTSEVLVDKPHNIFFEALAGGGVLLTLALIVLLAAIVYFLTSLLRRQRFVGAVFLGAFAAWFIQMQFVFDSVASLALLFLLLGISIATRNETNDASMRLSRTPLTLRGRWIMIFSIMVTLVIFVYVIFLPIKKVRAMYRFYEMQLPARADMWGKLSGISPMGDRYDSALIFSSVYDAYLQKVADIRDGDALLKSAVITELDSMTAYLNGLLKSEGATYELIMVNAQLHYVRLYVDPRNVPQIWESALMLAEKAHELSPTDPRPIELLKLLQASKK